MWGPLVTAMVTPFDDALEVDFDRAAELADHLVNTGSSAVLACGTTGESPTLTHDEELQLIRVVKDAVGGRAKVMAGTGSNSTATAVWMTREASKLGLDGAMLVCPYYNKPTQDMLYEHFKTVAAATELPVLLYNIASRTGRNIEPATIGRLAHEVPNIVALKEASGDVNQFAAMALAVPAGFHLYSGNDSDTPAILCCGGCGVVSVASHVVGQPIRAMIEAYRSGRFAEGVAAYLRLMPLFNGLFPADSVNPAPIKEALRLCGIDCGGLRPPLAPVSAARSAALRGQLEQLGVV
ncbi:MAG: 4-hydroxy-tetrahydrodipicolinate synthase [Fimbriimonadaceae bacterium]|nr:4-hydroxy-tetrahydrodipicolinate synthase [Fimbriimonadaceae bacterium]